MRSRDWLMRMRITSDVTSVSQARGILLIIATKFSLATAHESKKNVPLVWDEMRVKAGIAVGRGSGKLIGFTCLDSISEEIKKLSTHLETDVQTPQEATHLLVFMVRGLTNNVNLPFLWFPCVGTNAAQLGGCVWVATSQLELIGLKVRACIRQ